MDLHVVRVCHDEQHTLPRIHAWAVWGAPTKGGISLLFAAAGFDARGHEIVANFGLKLCPDKIFAKAE